MRTEIIELGLGIHLNKRAVPSANTWTGQKMVYNESHFTKTLLTRDKDNRTTDGLRTLSDKETEDAQSGEDILNDMYKQYIKTIK